MKLKNTIIISSNHFAGSHNSTHSLINTNLDLFNSDPTSSSNIYVDDSVSSLDTDILRTQSFILKNVINLLPILIQSKRFLLTNIAEFYVGFLQSIYCLKTQFLSKLIKSKLFESQGNSFKLKI